LDGLTSLASIYTGLHIEDKLYPDETPVKPLVRQEIRDAIDRKSNGRREIDSRIVNAIDGKIILLGRWKIHAVIYVHNLVNLKCGQNLAIS
jgi:hypothetical protein